MNAYLKHLAFDFRAGIRDHTLLLMNYLFPLGFYALVGGLMTKVNPGFTATIIPAIIIVAIYSAAILSLPNPIIEAREAGIFRSYRINGVPAANLLSVPAVTVLFHLVIVAVIVTATASPLFGGQLPVNWVGFFLAFSATAFACTGLGLLIGVLSPSGRVSVLLSQMIFLPSMVVGGIMMPTELLPESIRHLGLLLPSSYGMSAFQGMAMGQTGAVDPRWSLLILLTAGAVAFALAAYLFQWDSRNPTRSRRPVLAVLAMLPYAVGMALL